MASGVDDRAETTLTEPEREWLRSVREASGLAALCSLTDTTDEHEAYFRAKDRYSELRARELAAEPERSGIPGTCLTVDGTRFCVHGITHADTEAEGSFLRRHVDDLLSSGASVYCEQGIRTMYFRDRSAVCEIDDYEWAMEQCRALSGESHLGVPDERRFDGVGEELDSLIASLRDSVFELLDGGEETALRTALGDLASDFLTSHADLATGEEFESFRKTRAAARDPSKLRALQHYYERRFLPQPIEREWLRRHDRELEILTHARNERMADYAVYHADDEPVHLLVGAAHQPGVRYYLQAHDDGERTLSGFELVG